NFNTSGSKGNYYYYTIRKPLNQQLGLTFSKKFMSDNLSVSLYANDILNTNRHQLGIAGTDLFYNSRYDSRRIGFSLNYKIPSKNKHAKEEGNILSNDKPQEEDMIGN